MTVIADRDATSKRPPTRSKRPPSDPAGRRYLSRMTLYETEEKRELLRPDAFEEVARHDPWSREIERLSRGGHWLSRLQDVDLKSYLPDDILTKVDRMSMAHSLETRVPLLDHKVVEFAAKIPPEMQLSRGRSKRVLKRAMAGLLPQSVFERPKRGFAIPLGRWFRGPLKDFPRDLLLSERSRRRGIFDTAAVERILTDAGRGGVLDLPVWTLLSFELWCRAFLDRRPKAVVAGPVGAPHRVSVLMDGACRAGIV